MATDIIGHCWHCGRDLAPSDYGREALCLGCGKPTRVCRNCRQFAPGRPNACLEPMTELVADKEKARRKYKNAVVDDATIDDILLLYVKGVQAK